MQGFQSKFRARFKGLDGNLQRRNQSKSKDSSPVLQNVRQSFGGSANIENSIHKLGCLLEDVSKVFSTFSESIAKNPPSFHRKIELSSMRSESLYEQKNYPPIDQKQSHKIGLSGSDYFEKNNGTANFLLPKNFASDSFNFFQNSMKDKEMPYMQERFKLIHIEVPELKSNIFQQKMDEIFNWLSSACKKIFSACFQLFLDNTLNQKVVKVYCSENLLYRIIELIKLNQLTSKQIKQINIFLKQIILPYFELKYPQSETDQVNLRLSNKLAKIDNYINNSNDLVFQSKVKFQYKEKADYSGQIMQVLNYIIRVPNKVDKYQIQNSQFLAKNKIIEQQRKKHGISSSNSIYKAKRKSDISNQDQKQDYYENYEDMTLYSAFYKDMEFLFKNLEDQDEFIRMKQGLSPQDYARNYQKQVISDKNPSKKKLYKQKVKQYTKYLIGRKISESIDQYTYDQVKGKNVIVKNSQILRILNKWCNHLRQKFEKADQIIENRDQPFRMQDGSQGYLSKTHRIILRQLMKREQNNINNYLQKVLQNNYLFQEESSKRQLPKKMKWYSKEESTVGMFTATLFYNNENYIIGYLNNLIHSLLVVSNDFQRIVELQQTKNLKKQIRKKLEENLQKICNGNLSIDQFMEFIDANKKQKKKNHNYQSIPQLVTFRIGDLLRCRCSSKQTEINAIYNQIMRVSDSSSPLWKIIRIKNRLHKGTKDILINLNYRQKIIVQIQLQVDEAKSNFIIRSSTFKHYLYELGRAQFGPISQMSSIWMNHDHRASFFRKKYFQLNQRQLINDKTHDCEKKIASDKNISQSDVFQSQLFPFVCFTCKKLWTNSNFIENHSYCNMCRHNFCGQCKIEMDKKIIEPHFRAALKNRYPEQKSMNFDNLSIPNFGACMKLFTKQTIVKRFRKVDYQYQQYIFEILPENKHSKVAEITSQAQKNQFIRNYTILSMEGEINAQFSEKQSLREQQRKKQQDIMIAQQYFLPREFQLIMKQKKSSIMMQKKNIKDQSLNIIQICQDILKINFSENQLTKFDLVINRFPKIQIIVMAQNKIQYLPQTITNISQSLQYLDLSYNKIEKLPQQFSNLTSLTYLNLGHNSIPELPSMGNLDNLKVLIMGNNKLEKIDKLPFNIKKIDFQYNKFKGLVNLQNLKELIVLNLSFNKIQQIQGLQDCGQLSNLDLSNNVLKFPKFFNMYALENLNLSYNKIQQIILKYDHPQQSNIKIVNLSFNKFKSLSDEFYKNIQNVENLSLADNKLESISQEIFNLKRIQQLNISSIRKKKQKKTPPVKQEQTINQLTKQLSESNLHNQEEQIHEKQKQQILPPKTHYYVKTLERINLSNNQLKQIPETLSRLSCLKQLDLSSNQIRKLDIILTVEHLDLSTNKISQFTAQTAKKLTTLKFLSLKNNKNLENLNVPDIKSVIKSLHEIQVESNTAESEKSLKKSQKSNSSFSSNQEIQNSGEKKKRKSHDQGKKSFFNQKQNLLTRIPSGLKNKYKHKSNIQETIQEEEEADKENLQ